MSGHSKIDLSCSNLQNNTTAYANSVDPDETAQQWTNSKMEEATSGF